MVTLGYLQPYSSMCFGGRGVAPCGFFMVRSVSLIPPCFSIHPEALCPSQRMPVSVTLPQKQGRWAEADLSLNENQSSLEERECHSLAPHKLPLLGEQVLLSKMIKNLNC